MTISRTFLKASEGIRDQGLVKEEEEEISWVDSQRFILFANSLARN